MVEVTFVGKQACHLCETAQPVVAGVVAEFAGQVTLIELDIADDRALAERWSEDLPVVLIDGRPHASWRVDADRLRDRIRRALD